MVVAGLQPGTKADVWCFNLAPLFAGRGESTKNRFVKLMETVTRPPESWMF
jgi:hypothetical protein